MHDIVKLFNGMHNNLHVNVLDCQNLSDADTMPRLPIDYINGIWLENDKPKEELTKFFNRLNISKIKANYVIKTHSKVEITLKMIEQDKSPISELSNNEKDESVMKPSINFNNNDSDPYTLYMKQYFPLGRFMELELLCDGVSEKEVNDPETGLWISKACIVNNVLYCKRKSDKLKLILYEARLITTTPTFLNEKTNCDFIQKFFWILEDYDSQVDKLMTQFNLIKLNTTKA